MTDDDETEQGEEEASEPAAEKPDFSELDNALAEDEGEGDEYEDPDSLSEEELDKLKEEAGGS